MDGFLAKEERANQKGGLIAIPAVKTRKQGKKLVNLAAGKKEKKDQNIRLAAQRHQIVAQKVKEKNGVKQNESYKTRISKFNQRRTRRHP